MRSVPAILLCLIIGGCSTDLPPPPVQAPPDANQVIGGIATGITDSHFAPPFEVTDPFNAPASSPQQWMVCLRSGASDETRRLTYSVFFGRDGNGKDGVYGRSRYSVHADNCATQTYHPLAGASPPAAAPAPSPTPEPKKHHKRVG